MSLMNNLEEKFSQALPRTVYWNYNWKVQILPFSVSKILNLSSFLISSQWCNCTCFVLTPSMSVRPVWPQEWDRPGKPGQSEGVLLGNFLYSNTSNFLYFKIFVWFLFALFASFVIQMLSEKKKIVCRFNLDKEKAKVVLYILTSRVPR